ncbi:MAG: hypothetical protein ACRDAP_17255 [Shewanella sp.]
MKRYMGLVVVWVGLSLGVMLGGENNKEMLEAFLSGNMGYWKTQIDGLRGKGSLSKEEERTLVIYEYEYIGFLMGKNRQSEAAVYFPEAHERLKALLERNSGDAELVALMAAFTGYEIGLSPYKAPFIGSRCFDHAQKAIKMAPDEPWGFLQLANVKYYAPSVFGGSKSVSLELFFKAKERFQKLGANGSWQYISLLRAIAQNYEALGDFPAALKWYDTILKQYPGYKWVAEDLKPNLLKKMNR